jgi:hypothetical protein
MSSLEKTPLRTQLKLLAVCLLAEIALCGFANSVRLHFAAVTVELWGNANSFLLLMSAGSIFAMNVLSIFAAAHAIVKKLEYRLFAALALPILLSATAIVMAICFFGKAQSSAAAALVAFISAMVANRFLPGKIWPPETLT